MNEDYKYTIIESPYSLSNFTNTCTRHVRNIVNKDDSANSQIPCLTCKRNLLGTCNGYIKYSCVHVLNQQHTCTCIMHLYVHLANIHFEFV